MKAILITLLVFLFQFSFAQYVPDKLLGGFDVKAKKMAEAPKKVYLNSFKIYYQMIAEVEKTSYGGRQFGGGSYTGDATARMAVGVQGVSPDQLQALTNQLYTKMVTDLESLGLEVLTATDIPSIEYFNEWTTIEGPNINEEQVRGHLMVVPEGYAYNVKKITKKGKEKGKGVLGVQTMYAGGPKISSQLEDAIVADVEIHVPSLWLDASSKLGTAKVKGGSYLRLATASKVDFVYGKLKKPGAPQPKAYIGTTLKKEVPINGVFDGEKFKAVATKSRTTVPDYAAFFTVEDREVSLTNYAECDGEVYRERVEQTVSEFMDISLNKLSKSLKGEKY